MEIGLQLLVEHLIARAAHLIDADALEEWAELFAEHGAYRVTTAEDFERGEPPTLMAADSRAMLREQVSALRQAPIGDGQRYRHLVSSTLVEEVNGNVARVISNFLVVRILRTGEQAVFATGRYLDRIRLEEEALFEERTVVLDSRAIGTLPAIPL